MSFEGEFAHYQPLNRLISSKKLDAFLKTLKVKDTAGESDFVMKGLITKKDLKSDALYQPNLIIAIDGSYQESAVEKGFPGATLGYVTVADVVMDLAKIQTVEKQEFPNPQDVQKVEIPTSIEMVFPGCNVITDDNQDPKAFFRKILYEELLDKENSSFPEGGETLLETYEYLLDLREKLGGMARLPKSPIDGQEDKDLDIRHGTYPCPYTGQPLYSTDALRLHELFKPFGSSGEMYGQTMATVEKLVFINILRSFEMKGWLSTLRRVAFFIDGPLAVFSTSSWLTKGISYELRRINEEQKKINHQDMIVVGIEKSGTFFNHFQELDTTREGAADLFPRGSALLLNDGYIKRNIELSKSTKPFGQDTYFGRKFFYKAMSGQRLVPVVASYTEYEKDIGTANPDQFSRLLDLMNLLDNVASNRYPNSITPLISAHAEAAIPLNIGQKIFDAIAREIRERSQL